MKRWEIYLDIIMELLVILAGALLLIFVLPKTLAFLWPFVAGWIISMIAHPVIEYLEKKVKLPKKFGSAILIAVVITAIIAVLYFAVRGIALQVIGFVLSSSGNYETGNYFPEEDRTFFKYFTTFLWKTV